MNYYTLVSSTTNTYTMPFIMTANTYLYFYLKKKEPGISMNFCTVKRTMLFGLLFNLFYLPLVATPMVRKTYKININQLFDQDESFLYKNNHFKALIRRIHKKQNHLINPDFDIGLEILKENKLTDSWFD